MAQITAAAQIFKCRAKNYGVPFSNRQSLGFPNHVTEKKVEWKKAKATGDQKIERRTLFLGFLDDVSEVTKSNIYLPIRQFAGRTF